MLNKALTFGLPFIQKDKNGHVVAPQIIEYANDDSWETAIVLDPAVYPGGSLNLVAPAVAKLSFTDDDSWGRLPATVTSKLQLDMSMLSGARRRAAALSRKMPLLATVVFDTASVVFTNFNPASYLKLHRGKRGHAGPTAASVLTTLQGDDSQSIGVLGGEVLCACGPIDAHNNPQPILVRCYLDDGSTVPLSWIYQGLNAALLTKDANNMVAQLTPTYRTPGGASGGTPSWRSCWVTSGTSDTQPIYSGASYRISAMLGAAPDANVDVTLEQESTAQRAVLPINSTHIVVSVTDANKVAINVGVGGSATAPAASVTLLGGGPDPTVVTGLPAKTIVLKTPPGPQAVVATGVASLDVIGAASVVAGMTAKANNSAVAVTDTGAGTFKVTVPIAAAKTHVDFAATDGAAAALDVYQVNIVVANAAPDLELGRHDGAADSVDSIDLTASLAGPADVLTATAVAAWSARIDSAVPLREGLRDDETGDFGATHWIDFSLAAPASAPQPAANSWTLPPLNLQVDTVVSDTSGDDSKQQSDVVALNLLSPFVGNTITTAGPVLGDATLTVSLTPTANATPIVFSKTLRVKGYDPFAISWPTFLSALQGDIQTYFREMVNDTFTDHYFPALTLSVDDLVALSLALFIGESNLAQFWNTNKVDHPVPAIPVRALGSRMIHFGPPGGVGIAQYDADQGDPPDRAASSFDWRANVAQGVRVLHRKFSSSINFRARERGRLIAILKSLPRFAQSMLSHNSSTMKRLDNALDNVAKVNSATMFGQIAQNADMALNCRIKLYNGGVPYRSNFGWTIPTASPAQPDVSCEDVGDVPALVHVCFAAKLAMDADKANQYDVQVRNRYALLKNLIPNMKNVATLGDFARQYNQNLPPGKDLTKSYPIIDLHAGG